MAFVRLGEWDTDTPIDNDTSRVNSFVVGDPPVDVEIETVIKHHNYGYDGKKYDIALLRLARDVKYSKFIKPICLPSKPTSRLRNRFKLTVTGLIFIYNMRGLMFQRLFSGWGKTEGGHPSDKKLKVDIDYVDKNSCNSKFSKSTITIGDGQVMKTFFFYIFLRTKIFIFKDLRWWRRGERFMVRINSM